MSNRNDKFVDPSLSMVFSSVELKQKVVNYDCFKEQEVTIERGGQFKRKPDRVFIVGQYPYHITVRVEFDQPGRVTTHYNTSFLKADMACGAVILKGINGHTIVPVEQNKPHRTSHNFQKNNKPKQKYHTRKK